ncbi:MAG TPA: DUF418 domain-containing protein [Chitinophagaceae bacterium]|nr:DUF418 domain-containing protein [Chitinophagaceae bacterium]
MPTVLQPLSQSNRDTSLDMLRGFALAGVLLTFCAGDVGSPAAYTNSFWDEAVKWTKWILIENRMYTMLIIIFGIGFHVQLEKAKQKGTSLVPVFTRRLAGLLVIGFVHAILLSTRDILMFYGIAGIVLLYVKNATNRQLFLFMAILFFIVTPLVARFQEGFRAFDLAQPNNFSDHVQHNWQFFKLYHQIYPIYCEMVIHFMLGFIIGRLGILQAIKTNKKLRSRLLIASVLGSAILIPLCYFWFPKAFPAFASHLHHSWEKFLAAIFARTLWLLWMFVSVTLYATTLLGLWNSTNGKKWLSPLAPFGQMALSNYLIQSIVLVPYLLAFDKYNNIPPFSGFILFLIVLALQLFFSSWWMRRYTMGPFEWLLRSFTYWKWQTINKSAPVINDYQPIFLIKN